MSSKRQRAKELLKKESKRLEENKTQEDEKIGGMNMVNELNLNDVDFGDILDETEKETASVSVPDELLNPDAEEETNYFGDEVTEEVEGKKEKKVLTPEEEQAKAEREAIKEAERTAKTAAVAKGTVFVRENPLNYKLRNYMSQHSELVSFITTDNERIDLQIKGNSKFETVGKTKMYFDQAGEQYTADKIKLKDRVKTYSTGVRMVGPRPIQGAVFYVPEEVSKILDLGNDDSLYDEAEVSRITSEENPVKVPIVKNKDQYVTYVMSHFDETGVKESADTFVETGKRPSDANLSIATPGRYKVDNRTKNVKTKEGGVVPETVFFLKHDGGRSTLVTSRNYISANRFKVVPVVYDEVNKGELYAWYLQNRLELANESETGLQIPSLNNLENKEDNPIISLNSEGKPSSPVLNPESEAEFNKAISSKDLVIRHWIERDPAIVSEFKVVPFELPVKTIHTSKNGDSTYTRFVKHGLVQEAEVKVLNPETGEEETIRNEHCIADYKEALAATEGKITAAMIDEAVQSNRKGKGKATLTEKEKFLENLAIYTRKQEEEDERIAALAAQL